MQILGLFGMYFDAVVVEVETFFTFIQIGSGHTVIVIVRLISSSVSTNQSKLTLVRLYE